MEHARKIDKAETDVQKKGKAITIAKALINQQLEKYEENKIDLASTFARLYRYSCQ
jgi:hypothetical protein